MSEEQIFNSVVHALESTGTPYMLVGSFSTNFYGVPCATHDLDVVIEFDALDVSGLIGRLGPEFFLAPQGSFEAIAVTRRHIIRVRGSGFTIELFVRSNDEHDRERFTRRRRVKVFDRETYLPTPEDVVIIKLR